MLITWDVIHEYRQTFRKLLEQGLEMLLAIPEELKGWRELYGSQAISSLSFSDVYRYPFAQYDENDKDEIRYQKERAEKMFSSLKKIWEEKFYIETKIEQKNGLTYVVFTVKEHRPAE